MLLEQILAVYPREAIFAPPELQAWQQGAPPLAPANATAASVGRRSGGLPSMDELLDAGRKVMFVSGSDYGIDMAPLVFKRGHTACNWTEPNMVTRRAAVAQRRSLALRVRGV